MASATESKILSNYLLVPAQLPAIASLEEFIGFFPRAMQESPAIRTLYRDLQTQRNAVVDSVAEEIDDQVQRGKAIRRHIVKTKRREQAHEYDDEIEMERMVRSYFTGKTFRLGEINLLVALRCQVGPANPKAQHPVHHSRARKRHH